MAVVQVTELGTNLTELGQSVTAFISDELSSEVPNLYGTQVEIMGYTTGTGRYANTVAVTLATGTVAATTTSPATEFGDRSSLRLDLVISAQTGTSPTLDVKVQTSPDNSTWTDVASFAQQTGAATVHKLFAPIDRFVRIVETIGGSASPSFTRTISGEAV